MKVTSEESDQEVVLLARLEVHRRQRLDVHRAEVLEV
jgi:hypothetical protein